MLFALGIGLQALEARVGPAEQALRLSLFRRLVRRPRWLAGTALGLAGWVAQGYALTRAPLTLVQPLLAANLVFLLAVSARQLGERVGRRERLAVLAVAAGVPLLALTAPSRETGHAHGARLWVALGVLGALALAPLGLRGLARSASILVPFGAGVGYALDGIATKFAADDYVRRLWLGLVLWALLMGVAAGLGTLAEMSALQRRPAAHVVPLVMALNTFVPVALAPLLVGELWPGDPLRTLGLVAGLGATGAGVLVLGRAEPVARAVAPDASSTDSGTARRPRAASDDPSSSMAETT